MSIKSNSQCTWVKGEYTHLYEPKETQGPHQIFPKGTKRNESGFFPVHCAGALSNHHLAHKTTHGTTHHSLHESLAQCGCVSFDVFEIMGPGLLKSLNKACERERGKHNYLREEKISIKLTHSKAQQRDERMQYGVKYEKLQKKHQRGGRNRHNVKREGGIMQKKNIGTTPNTPPQQQQERRQQCVLSEGAVGPDW